VKAEYAFERPGGLIWAETGAHDAPLFLRVIGHFGLSVPVAWVLQSNGIIQT
jgi:hypothetical protein